MHLTAIVRLSRQIEYNNNKNVGEKNVAVKYVSPMWICMCHMIVVCYFAAELKG